MTLSADQPSYTYAAGSDIADPNATALVDNFQFGSPSDTTSDIVTFDFQSSTPLSTLTVLSQASSFSGSLGTNWVGAYSLDGGTSFTSFFSIAATTASNNQPQTDVLSVPGATDVIIRYTASNTAVNDYWLQLFRSADSTPSQDFTFTVTADYSSPQQPNLLSTPEPASLAIWGLVIVGGLLLARSRKA